MTISDYFGVRNLRIIEDAETLLENLVLDELPNGDSLRPEFEEVCRLLKSLEESMRGAIVEFPKF